MAANGDEVVEILRGLTPKKARVIGEAALKRVLAEHTYEHRAAQLEAVLEGHAREVIA
ncbi:MAG TPA: glycosyltransferase [Verrucomicrobiae bacterium]|nr:glycosyltransferase [Verrucomicrobiae bacterium]